MFVHKPTYMNIYRNVTIKFKEKEELERRDYGRDSRAHNRGWGRKRERGEETDIIVFRLKAY